MARSNRWRRRVRCWGSCWTRLSIGAAAPGSGDRLLLYTDGVTEAANDAGEEFGAERLAGVLDGGVEPLPEQWRTIMERVREHANGNFADDATLLLISAVR